MIPAAFSFLAQTPASQPSALQTFFPLILMAVMLYFMMIRPQQRRQKEHMARLAALKTGDEVITASGIHGLITNVAETTVTLKIADSVKIKVEKSSVASITSKSTDAEVIPTEVLPS